MARTTSNLTEAINLLEIIRRIPFHPTKISSSDLYKSLEAKKIKMSLRTLQRALDALQKSDLGILCDKSSKPYGYSREMQTQGLETFKLDDQTSLLLRLAQQHLKFQMPADLTNSLEYLFSQAKEEGLEPRSQHWLSKVAVVPGVLPQDPPKFRPLIFDRITEGLLHEKQLQIEYINTNQDKSRLRVLPLGLVQQEVRLYLVCRDLDDPVPNHLRHLAVHRIQSVKVTDLSFVPPPDFSLKKYIAGQHFNYGTDNLVRLTLVFSNPRTAVNLRETPFNRTQKLTKIASGKYKGKYRLVVDVEDSLLLKGWIKTWEEIADIIKIDKKPLNKEADMVPAS